MSELTLESLPKKSEFLIAIDSDGCAFDSMEIKHKECFIPNFIKYMHLQPVSKYAREACEFVNLYSKDRGANRFPAYLKALDLLAARPQVQARGFKVPALQGVRDWVKRESKLSTKTLKVEAEKISDPDLQQALAWSSAVDQTVADLVHGVPPFPLVRESLQKVQGRADVIVCSATPFAALTKEWQEHNIAQFVGIICGQEVGSKKEILETSRKKGYSPDNMLMIGDAPGDFKAAQAVGAHFYPINPGAEEASWERFFNESCDRFFQGTFGGDYEKSLITEFETYLPELPPWQRG